MAIVDTEIITRAFAGEQLPQEVFPDVCRLLGKMIGVAKNLRARVDELWRTSVSISKMVQDEQARCTRIQREVKEAIDALHECQRQKVAIEVRLVELLKDLADK